MIIILCGRKQSGKNTVANYIAGMFLKEKEIIEDFTIESGGLLTYKRFGKWMIASAGFSTELFPFVQFWSFADQLKKFCIEVLGLSKEQCYGEEEQKNTLTNCSWNKVPEDIKKKYNVSEGKMTAREVMQVFGTDMIRAMYYDAWALATYNAIVKLGDVLSIITDGRFPNEIEYGKKFGAKSIRLLRVVSGDTHESEKALDDYHKFDIVIDNSNMNIEEQNSMVWPLVRGWFKEGGLL
jgi:hypothetical protein